MAHRRRIYDLALLSLLLADLGMCGLKRSSFCPNLSQSKMYTNFSVWYSQEEAPKS